MVLDAVTTELLAQAAAAGAPPLHEMTPAQAREMGAASADLVGPGPDMARVVEAEVTTTGQETFRVRVLVPHGETRAVIAYYHGGGWVLGDIDGYDTVGRTLAQATSCAVVLVDYRKAPEHPFPAAVDDAWNALEWVDAGMDELFGARLPLIVAGDSAGGNLAAVLTQRSRDEFGPRISQQILVYPVTDADTGNGSYTDPENQLMLRRETMEWFFDHYVADAARRRDPAVSPLRASSLAGLPPALVLTAEHDVLREEGETYARALADAGVPVTSRRLDGQMHGFFTMVNILPGSAEAFELIATAVTEHLGASHA